MVAIQWVAECVRCSACSGAAVLPCLPDAPGVLGGFRWWPDPAKGSFFNLPAVADRDIVSGRDRNLLHKKTIRIDTLWQVGDIRDRSREPL